jgi:hypothetical protein
MSSGDESLLSASRAAPVETRETLAGPDGRAHWSLGLGRLDLEFHRPTLFGFIKQQFLSWGVCRLARGVAFGLSLAGVA